MAIRNHNGTGEALPEYIILRAGSLTMRYEAGTLRNIRLGEHEIVRGIYAAVRDQNWGTVPVKLHDVKLDNHADSFRLTFTSEHVQDDIHFIWKGTIQGDANSSIQFSFDGEALSSFKRNRIGFCVLHPMSVASLSCEVEHTNGSTEQGTFPQFIVPHQPFFNIRAVSHEVLPGIVAQVRMDGDIFEMEDQRNWVDASYKTYCTPLSLPFPALVESHTKVQQTITVQVSGITEPIIVGDPSPILEINTNDGVPLPPIGLCNASHGEPLTQQETDLLKSLCLAHLRVDLNPSEDLIKKLRQSMHEADGLGCALELAIHLSSDVDEELQQFRSAIDLLKPNIARLVVFREGETSTHRSTVAAARRILAPYGAPLGSGTDAFYAELNRNHPPADLLDWITYSINPQVHAFDNASLIETLPAQAVTIESTRQFSMDTKIAISPVTFKMRWNPNATAPEPEQLTGSMPRRADMRQMALFGAVWTLGSIKSLVLGGADSLTYYETTGWLGVMPSANQNQYSEQPELRTVSVYPLYHVFADIAPFVGGEVLSITSNQPQKCDALVLRCEGSLRIMVANYTPETQRVTIKGPAGNFTLKKLDEMTLEESTTSADMSRNEPATWIKTDNSSMEIELLPYAYVRLDFKD